jgi:hypothetical protein
VRGEHDAIADVQAGVGGEPRVDRDRARRGTRRLGD